MPDRSVIIDTGPIVGFLVHSDDQHKWADRLFKSLPAPMLTCEAVLTEAFYLLSRDKNDPSRLFEIIDLGFIKVEFNFTEDRANIRELMRKYRDLPMSLADACLVRMAERRPSARVLTLDSHFRIYRRLGRSPVSTIMPELTK